ncbi:MAG: radical SAM protein [Pirellulales bacterium]|nr:radical SAM protein [Pirellulales bacterium]
MICSRNEKLRVLLIKPYQPVTLPIASPPLGVLYLASTLREKFGDAIEVRVDDNWLDKRRYSDMREELETFRPHVVGLSALNFEAEESARIADLVQRLLPKAKIALGGPFAHGTTNRDKIIETDLYDWIFDGEADWSFPITVERWWQGSDRLDDILGLTHRQADGGYVTNGCGGGEGARTMVGRVESLDAIPFPAWDLVDFDAYARRINNNGNMRGKRYAPIFTSRGCPFLCTYCHDIFGKKFIGRSPENVLAEVELLRDRYGIDELQIVDDIFNMNSRRMKEICRGLARHKLFICFPNGLRGDILDEEGVQALVDAGMYEVAVAIETVTPRLQDMIKKRLRLGQLLQAIDWMSDRGVMVKGFFMLGFPTETPEEMQQTVNFAVRSKLTHAVFNLVTPQPGTPIYDVAYAENAEALRKVVLHDYYAATCWYAEAYGADMHQVRSRAYFRFYLSSPARMWRLVRHMSMKDLFRGFYYWAQKVFVRTYADESLEDVLPDSMQSLRKLYISTDEAAVAAPVVESGAFLPADQLSATPTPR